MLWYVEANDAPYSFRTTAGLVCWGQIRRLCLTHPKYPQWKEAHGEWLNFPATMRTNLKPLAELHQRAADLEGEILSDPVISRLVAQCVK